MRKYIDADKAIKDYARYGIKHFYDATDLEAILNECPAADVAEVRHGHWKGINRNKYNDDEATCSICGVTFSSGYSDPSWWDYCPNCGAKMDEVEE